MNYYCIKNTVEICTHSLNSSNKDTRSVLHFLVDEGFDLLWIYGCTLQLSAVGLSLWHPADSVFRRLVVKIVSCLQSKIWDIRTSVISPQLEYLLPRFLFVYLISSVFTCLSTCVRVDLCTNCPAKCSKSQGLYCHVKLFVSTLALFVSVPTC